MREEKAKREKKRKVLEYCLAERGGCICFPCCWTRVTRIDYGRHNQSIEKLS